MEEGKCSLKCLGCDLAHSKIAEFEKQRSLRNYSYVVNRYNRCKIDDVECNVFNTLQNSLIPLEREARSNPVLLAYVKMYEPEHSYIHSIPTEHSNVFFEECEDIEEIESIHCCESCIGCCKAKLLIEDYIEEQKEYQEFQRYSYSYVVQKKSGECYLYPDTEQICCIFGRLTTCSDYVTRSNPYLLAYVELYKPADYEIQKVFDKHTHISFYEEDGFEKIKVHDNTYYLDVVNDSKRDDNSCDNEENEFCDYCGMTVYSYNPTINKKKNEIYDKIIDICNREKLYELRSLITDYHRLNIDD